ncbi:hypothetical protein P5673_004956 [Acropora cervicornis]|uniref:Uncharacterized protein n=1 Tax=Acropora cervicornis TaxID=6130 RepID=A0AAD9QZM5_ACRCE|nr:hypothetical protein P5673_004956 [Acropora cervicornis]
MLAELKCHSSFERSSNQYRMFSSPHFLYCNCVTSAPLLHCASAYAPWNCPLASTASEYGSCLDHTATHRGHNNEETESSAEPSTSRRLKFGIENILYGAPSQTGSEDGDSERSLTDSTNANSMRIDTKDSASYGPNCSRMINDTALYEDCEFEGRETKEKSSRVFALQ